MALEGLKAHNVIAAYPSEEQAREVVERLHDAGCDAKDISYLGAAAAERTDVNKLPVDVGKKVAKGSAAGGAIGVGAGFLAGLATIAIPGAGPFVGAGIWATMAGGGVAGATAGGVSGGIGQMWESHYKDSAAKGGALVGYHSDDEGEIEKVAALLREHKPQRLDTFDAEGDPLRPG